MFFNPFLSKLCTSIIRRVGGHNKMSIHLRVCINILVISNTVPAKTTSWAEAKLSLDTKNLKEKKKKN